MMRFRAASMTAALLALAGAPSLAWAQGGPPLMTDDPGTPDPGTWEVNVAVTGDLTSAGRGYELPVFDVN
ncbi:MAG TPA: hypothetical protein VFJ16_19120 [Longimicrobium sp.]|nr:hypothetical protein [Longimicrobium sp.]